MEKNISIKVSYQKTIRRFAVSKSTSWSELETSIRTLFSLPSTFAFALTYTDEDSDIITLRSDLELRDILSQPHHSSALKFTLVPYDTQFSDSEGSAHGGIDYNISNPEIEKPSQSFSPSFPSLEASELVFPEFKSDEKGKQRAEHSFEEQDPSDHPESSPCDEQLNDEEQSITPPSVDLAAKFQKLIDQFRPLIEQQPHLIKQANEVMDQILQNASVDIEMWIQWFKDQIADVQRNISEANTKFKEEDIFERIVQSGQAIANNACRFIECRGTRSMTEEEKDEKLKLLRSMGFWDDRRNEELLKKYCGKVEKVVEILLTEKNDAAEYTFVDNEVQMEEI